MNRIEKLASYRENKGYYERDFAKYVTFLKTVYKSDKIYAAEIFFAKSLDCKNRKLAKKFMKKAIKTIDNDSELYLEYVQTMYKYLYNQNSEILNDLLQLRQKLATVSILSDEIDGYIRKIDSNAVPKKIEYSWKDITLQFSNEGDLTRFQQKVHTEKSDYNSKLQNLIVTFIKNEQEFFTRIHSHQKNTLKVHKFCKILVESLDKLIEFLDSNFQKSERCLTLQNELKIIIEFLQLLNKYQDGDVSVENDIETFIIDLNEYKDIAEFLEYYKKNTHIYLKSAQKKVLQFYLKKLKISDSVMKTPFLPVFYDIAADYINYPETTDRSKSQFFSRFKFR